MNSINKMVLCLALIILLACLNAVSVSGEEEDNYTSEKTICIRLKFSDIDNTPDIKKPPEWGGNHPNCAMYGCGSMHITMEPLCVYARTQEIGPSSTGECNMVEVSENYMKCNEETAGKGCHSCVYGMHVGGHNKHCKKYQRIYRCCKNLEKL